jgi:hypothetical protein
LIDTNGVLSERIMVGAAAAARAARVMATKSVREDTSDKAREGEQIKETRIRGRVR